jgi:tRNA 2-thiouridine synthesizing protein A
MEAKILDCRGMKCPRPSLQFLSISRETKPGDIVEIVADCPTFEEDMRKLCLDMKRALLFVKVEGPNKRVQVRM